MPNFPPMLRCSFCLLLLLFVMSTDFSQSATFNEKIIGEETVKNNDDFNETASSVNETATLNEIDEINSAKGQVNLFVIVCSLFGIGLVVFISSVIIWNPIYRKRKLSEKAKNDSDLAQRLRASSDAQYNKLKTRLSEDRKSRESQKREIASVENEN